MGIEKLKVLLNRIPYLMIALGWCAWEGWNYYGFIENDPNSPLKVKQQQVVQAEQGVQQLRKKVQEGREFSQSLEHKREELRQLAQRLTDMRETLSEQIDIPAVLKLVLTEAQKLRISVRAVKPGKEISKDLFTEQSFDMEFRGLYSQFVAFLSRIASSTTIIKTGKIELKPDSDQAERYVPLIGKVELKAFRYSGSKADEIAINAKDPNYKYAPAASKPGARPSPALRQPPKPGTPPGGTGSKQ